MTRPSSISAIAIGRYGLRPSASPFTGYSPRWALRGSGDLLLADLRRRAPIVAFGRASENHHLPSRFVSTGPAVPLVPVPLERPPDGLDRVVVLKRHLSEVLRPFDDIIGWSPAHPFGLSRAYHTRHLPPSSFLSSSTACASADLPALFHAGAVHGVSRARFPSSRRGWRRETDKIRPTPSSMAALPKLNCNARKSALERGPKPHLRLEPAAKPHECGTPTG